MTSAQRDYYDVLGVDRAAGAAAIRKAFRARARHVHPDVSGAPDAEERFRELAEAYSVLSRTPSRLLYDRLGYRGRGHGGFAPFARQARKRAEAEAREAVGLAPEVHVGFFEAHRGTTATALLGGTAACRACGGRGEESAEPGPCPACEGTGRLSRTARDDSARVLQIERCHRCHGRGTAGPPCRACGGSGRVELRGQVLVTVPSGARDGQRIALAEGGDVVVRVVGAPRESRAVRLVAAVGLVVALALLAVVLLG